jgi:hypothetical protein
MILYNKNAFNFKYEEGLHICQKCYYCQKERFTDEQIVILSNKKLTFEQFQTCDFAFANPLCSITDSTNFWKVNYNFRYYWLENYNTLEAKRDK